MKLPRLTVPTQRPKPLRAQRRRVRLVVVEAGAGAFDSYLSPDECEELVVVSQGADEQPPELSSRVSLRLEALERSGRVVPRALLLVAPRWDSAHRLARMHLGALLLGHSERHLGTPTELVLALAGEPSGAMSVDLLALLEEMLMTGLASERHSIGLRFGAAATHTLRPPRGHRMRAREASGTAS